MSPGAPTHAHTHTHAHTRIQAGGLECKRDGKKVYAVSG